MTRVRKEDNVRGTNENKGSAVGKDRRGAVMMGNDDGAGNKKIVAKVVKKKKEDGKCNICSIKINICFPVCR